MLPFLGSPPRAWGRRDPLRGAGQSRRFTPTCVGKAPHSRRACVHLPVHPHVRGEGDAGRAAAGREAGSPPRAWGRRIVPVFLLGRWAVHPHVRGEGRIRASVSFAPFGSPPRAWGRRARIAAVIALNGSPPRAWGRHDDQQPRGAAGRFTPTCVGKAVDRVNPAPTFSVHPHVRGEGQVDFTGDGAPAVHPHVRGEGGFCRGRSGAGGRFTPTCVGKAVGQHAGGNQPGGSPPRAWGRRPGASGRTLTPTVHPHVRGEGSPRQHARPGAAGSPPRAWGRLGGLLDRHTGRRFTPTCVGKAAGTQSATGPPPVHPHVRGEGTPGGPTSPDCGGSPPRAWGRRPVRSVVGLHPRFTPTCVGKAG